jgi:prolyl-tRNA synthetase
MEEESSEGADCPVPADRLRSRRGIEVGHIFASAPSTAPAWDMTVQTPDGGNVHPQMGSYGIGVSRLIGAIIEASHDDAGIVWPEAVAPFRVGLINMRADDPKCAAAADDLYARLAAAGVETLYDDRDERGGAKFAPWT